MKRLIKTVCLAAAASLGPHRWSRGAARLWILTYHRVLPSADPRSGLEEPGMMVTPDTLRNNLSWLREFMEIVSLRDWVDAVRDGKPVPPHACAITFDDGWRDNYEHAFPILQEAQAPATVFVVSHMIGTTACFWPNRLVALLHAAGPAVDTTPSLAWLRQLTPIPLSAIADPDARSAIIGACKSVTDAELERLIEQSERELEVAAETEASLLSWEELREMIESGIVDIGSHTRRHVRLNDDLSADGLEAEVSGSRNLLAERLARPISLFCYPNGDYTERTSACVESHYAAAVTTQRGINTVATPLTELRRISIHESSGSSRTEFLAHLSGWL